MNKQVKIFLPLFELIIQACLILCSCNTAQFSLFIPPSQLPVSLQQYFIAVIYASFTDPSQTTKALCGRGAPISPLCCCRKLLDWNLHIPGASSLELVFLSVCWGSDEPPVTIIDPLWTKPALKTTLTRGR